MQNIAMHHSPTHHETIIHNGTAYSYLGVMVIIGKLALTAEHLTFTTHRLNYSQFTISIPLREIREVSLKNHLRIFNHGIMITQNNGESDVFAVWKRKRWQRWIEEARLHARA